MNRQRTHLVKSILVGLGTAALAFVPPILDSLPVFLLWAAIALTVGGAVGATWYHKHAPPRPPDLTPRCACCGYNLTGNVSGVCPECGAAVAVKVASTSEE